MSVRPDPLHILEINLSRVTGPSISGMILPLLLVDASTRKQMVRCYS